MGDVSILREVGHIPRMFVLNSKSAVIIFIPYLCETCVTLGKSFCLLIVVVILLPQKLSGFLSMYQCVYK
jgi:hypothetical protein